MVGTCCSLMGGMLAGHRTVCGVTSGPNPGGRPSHGAACYARPVTDRRLPLHEGLDALHAWARAPSATRRADVRGALARLTDANGLVGAYLDVDAPPLPRLRLGVGTLARRPQVVTPPLRSVPLVADEGRIPLGRLILDPGRERHGGRPRRSGLARHRARPRRRLGPRRGPSRCRADGCPRRGDPRHHGGARPGDRPPAHRRPGPRPGRGALCRPRHRRRRGPDRPLHHQRHGSGRARPHRRSAARTRPARSHHPGGALVRHPGHRATTRVARASRPVTRRCTASSACRSSCAAPPSATST